MTSEQHEQPGQVCTCGHPSVDHDDDNVCTWELGPEDNGTDCPCIDYRTRPTAPSEPPAKTQQDDEREAVERIASQYRDPDAARFAINDFRDWLAARSSADTETLRRVRELAAEWTAPGRARTGNVSILLDQLRAALDAR